MEPFRREVPPNKQNAFEQAIGSRNRKLRPSADVGNMQLADWFYGGD
jgi:hypothetical protein